MSNLILDSLEIKNFRTFKQLVIEKLARVNLIVGKNGVGKSALLEALQLYAGQAHATIIEQLLENRDERPQIPPEQIDTIEIDALVNTIRYLFHGYPEIPDEASQHNIYIGAIDSPENSLSITLGWHQMSLPESDEKSVQVTILREPVVHPYTLRDKFLGITIRKGNEGETATLTSYVDPRLKGLWQKADTKFRFVPAAGVQTSQMVKDWEKIALSELETDITNALKIIEPGIERIHFGTNPYRAWERIPEARVNGSRMPIRTFGEGALRILGLGLALTNAQNGMLLVDEIESGLHYTVQVELWQLVFQLAKRLNVQVFATTHSDDCVRAFQYVAHESMDIEAEFIRLEIWQGLSKAIVFDEDRLTTAIEGQIEIR
jgi:energy-coupling factor transporter ATP-binding protein EcfA2